MELNMDLIGEGTMVNGISNSKGIKNLWESGRFLDESNILKQIARLRSGLTLFDSLEKKSCLLMSSSRVTSIDFIVASTLSRWNLLKRHFGDDY